VRVCSSSYDADDGSAERFRKVLCLPRLFFAVVASVVPLDFCHHLMCVCRLVRVRVPARNRRQLTLHSFHSPCKHTMNDT
jgi:hypothetical protein